LLLLYRSLVGEMTQGLQEFDTLFPHALKVIDPVADKWFADTWKDFMKRRVDLLAQATRDFGGIAQKR
jgi:hypothetical protein